MKNPTNRPNPESPDGGMYNIILTGFGYLNRIREVNPEQRGASPYLSVNINLLEGEPGKAENCRFSAVVKGEEAERILRRQFSGSDGSFKTPSSTVMASVVLGGVKPDTFKGTDGSSKIILKTRLLAIKWLKVNETVIDLAHGGPVAEHPELSEEDIGLPVETGTGTPDRKNGTADLFRSKNPGREDRNGSENRSPLQPAFAKALLDEHRKTGFIRLSMNQEDFNERKNWVKSQGFRWNREETAWFRPAAN